MTLPNGSHEGCLVHAKRLILLIDGAATIRPKGAYLPDRCSYSTNKCRSHGTMWPFVGERKRWRNHKPFRATMFCIQKEFEKSTPRRRGHIRPVPIHYSSFPSRFKCTPWSAVKTLGLNHYLERGAIAYKRLSIILVCVEWRKSYGVKRWEGSNHKPYEGCWEGLDMEQELPVVQHE